MFKDNNKEKHSMEELEEKAKKLEKSTRETMEHIEKSTRENIERMEEDIKETLEASDRERAEIVDELMTPPNDELEDESLDEDAKEISEEIKEETQELEKEGVTYGSVNYNKGNFTYKPCKMVKNLDITSKIILILAVITMVIIAMQKQPIMSPFGEYIGYEWQPISLAYAAISGFSGYVFYLLINAASKLLDDIDKTRQLKEFEVISKLQQDENN